MDRKAFRQTIGTRLKPLGFVMGALALAALSFMAGRQTAIPAVNLVANETIQSPLSAMLIQNQNNPREMIPLPGPGQGPGFGFGQQPGQGECPILLYQDGQLFQLQPGQGMPGMPGGPGGSQELIPLQPFGPQQTPPPNVGPSQFAQFSSGNL